MIPNMTPGAAAQLVSSTPQKTTLSNLETPIFLLKSNLHIDRLMVEDDDGRSINVLSSADIMRSKYAETISGELFDNAAAMLSASHYKPVRLLLMPEGARGSSFPVHNSEIAYRLQSRYTLRQFCDLENWLYQMGVFSLMVSKDNGLVRTCGADENPEMSIRQWITDTCRCGDIQRKMYPASWPKALMMLARFYRQAIEVDAFEHSIRDPRWYRQGPLENGVAHVFFPSTFERDPDYNNSKRLESHGLALKSYCDTLVEGLQYNAPWGFDEKFLSNRSELALITDTIAYLASYIRAINTNPDTGEIDFSAPSCGNWEEVPFAGGLTWDIEAMRQGLMSLYRLMFGPCPDGVNNVMLVQIRCAIASHKHSSWMSSERELIRLIEAARQKVIQRIVQADTPCESPFREIDASLAFITTCNTILASNPIENARHHFRLLFALEESIVRDNGILRYAPFEMEDKTGEMRRVFDNYLGDNYWLMPSLRASLLGKTNGSRKKFKSLDCSTTDKFIERGSMAREGYEAEWCWVSTISEGYSTQVLALDYAVKNGDIQDSAEVKELMRMGVEKATEYMNRALARITGDGMVKSNGKACPAFAVPEAYEYVSSLKEPRTLVALPGVHTPLSWAVSSLHVACEKLKQAMKTMEQ